MPEPSVSSSARPGSIWGASPMARPRQDDRSDLGDDDLALARPAAVGQPAISDATPDAAMRDLDGASIRQTLALGDSGGIAHLADLLNGGPRAGCVQTPKPIYAGLLFIACINLLPGRRRRARPVLYGVCSECSVVSAGTVDSCERVGRGRFVRRGEGRSQASARSSNCLSAHERGIILGWVRLQFSSSAKSVPSSRT